MPLRCVLMLMLEKGLLHRKKEGQGRKSTVGNQPLVLRRSVGHGSDAPKRLIEATPESNRRARQGAVDPLGLDRGPHRAHRVGKQGVFLGRQQRRRDSDALQSELAWVES